MNHVETVKTVFDTSWALSQYKDRFPRYYGDSHVKDTPPPPLVLFSKKNVVVAVYIFAFHVCKAASLSWRVLITYSRITWCWVICDTLQRRFVESTDRQDSTVRYHYNAIKLLQSNHEIRWRDMVYLFSSKTDLYSAPVISPRYTISWYMALCYNDTPKHIVFHFYYVSTADIAPQIHCVIYITR